MLLAVAALFCAGPELLSRVAVPWVSRIEQRTVWEYRDAVATSRTTSTRQVLVVGNSLLNAGIRFDQARLSLAPGITVKRFLIEDTNYYDWYCGLRRLLSEGAHPDVVVVLLSPGQLLSPSARGDYFAYHLLRTRDLHRAVRDLRLSNTEASCLAFANVSAFFGLRAEIRKVIAGKVFPSLPRLMGLLTRRTPPPPIDAGEANTAAAARLRALREAASEHGVTVIVAISPTREREAPALASVVQSAGAAAGVTVLVPVTPGTLGADLYEDGFHLNDRGAAIFTDRFVASLRSQIGG